jgi:hypothetical protein
MTKATEVPPRRSRGRPSRRRSELERLLDLTVLGPTTQSWDLLAIHRDDHALRAHRQGAGQLYPPARLEAPPRPNSGGQGAPPPLRRLRLLEPGSSTGCHPRRESGLQAHDAVQARASAVGFVPIWSDSLTVPSSADPTRNWAPAGSSPGQLIPLGRLGKGPERFVHRLAWKLLRGPIPDGMELHHLCGIHTCWNPDHQVSTGRCST